MKLRIYLDTSVISAYFDDRALDRMAETRMFWLRLPEFQVSTSVLVHQEIVQTIDSVKRQQMLELLSKSHQMDVTPEAHDLAQAYVDRGLFTSTMYADALHLALSVLTRQDILVSWNFKHLVNRRKRAEVIRVNTVLDLPAIEILSPPEL